jgi:hypothetical protein
MLKQYNYDYDLLNRINKGENVELSQKNVEVYVKTVLKKYMESNDINDNFIYSIINNFEIKEVK